MIRRLPALLLLVFLGVNALFAQKWYDPYEKGKDAAKRENWKVVVQRMNEAIADKPAEDPSARPYGTIIVAYFPYYYRGIAYFHLGEFERAVSDLQKTKGPGQSPVKIGDAGTFLDRAQARIAAATQTTPTQTTPTTTVATTTRQPDVVTPPAVDPAVRREAEQALARARSRSEAARTAQAPTYAAEQWRQGSQRLTEANNKSAAAETTADWRAVFDAADRATRLFDASITNAQTAIAALKTTPGPATEEVVAPIKGRVRDALAAYYDGNYGSATRQLEALVREQKTNAMLWAFLGAARYYSYYLDGGDNKVLRDAAEQAFRQAHKLKQNLTLDENYFSARVRTFFRNVTSS